MKFKAELALLVLAITLFAVATFVYSYQNGSVVVSSFVAQSLAYPYRGLALIFVGIGTLFMVIASISFSKKQKSDQLKTAF